MNSIMLRGWQLRYAMELTMSRRDYISVEKQNNGDITMP
jgi:hypothetical protein